MNELEMEVAVSSIDFSDDHEKSAHKPDWWTDDGVRNSWQDVYTARRRVFPDGQCEVTVSHERSFQGAAITPQTRVKRGASENREANDDDAGRRAKKNVRHRCKAIGADRMVTLTYRENMVDRDQALKHWKAFCRRLGKVKHFFYVAVIEEQERGALHFHVAVQGRQNYALLRSIWQSVLGTDSESRQMGQVNVRDPHRFGFGPKGAHKLASYIAKYCGKSMSSRVPSDFVGPVRPVRVLDEKRYFSSKGIPVPEVQFWRLYGVTNMLDAARAAFDALTGHSLAGLQTWCNNGLGVVYLATEPGFLSDDEVCPF
jgi:hypothetical protein